MCWLETENDCYPSIKRKIVNSLDTNMTEILKEEQISELLSEAVNLGSAAKMCHLCCGKWIQNAVKMTELSSGTIVFQASEKHKPCFEKLQINQPVGISFQMEHQKCIFDSLILGIDSSAVDGVEISLAIPDRLEKMPRRSYERQPVPSSLNVNVLFWHRGYADNTANSPAENYWQGKLVNLSANGAQISTPLSLADCFKIGQLVGLQFTPMYYQKPVLVEGQIVHIQSKEEETTLNLGIEFLGLEVSIDGRNILHRLMDIVQEYAHQNNDPYGGNTTPTT